MIKITFYLQDQVYQALENYLFLMGYKRSAFLRRIVINSIKTSEVSSLVWKPKEVWRSIEEKLFEEGYTREVPRKTLETLITYETGIIRKNTLNRALKLFEDMGFIRAVNPTVFEIVKKQEVGSQ